jgi:hypothetical protein
MSQFYSLYPETLQFIYEDYPTRIRISGPPRKVYYEDGKIPHKFSFKKYEGRVGYKEVKLNGKVRNLLHLDDEIVIKNEKARGSDQYMTINGQHVLSSNLHPSLRDKVPATLKPYFREAFPLVHPRLRGPLLIGYTFFTLRKDIHDEDNIAAVYTKYFQDSLMAWDSVLVDTSSETGEEGTFERRKVPNARGFLKDDNVDYVRGKAYDFWKPLSEYPHPKPGLQRALIVTLYEIRNL